jgi:AP-4 complex subunit sigma-1
LYFIVGVDDDENELSILELIHFMVETLDRYFSNVCELDIMFNIDKAHMLIDEIVVNGCVVETNPKRVMHPIQLLDSTIAKD